MFTMIQKSVILNVGCMFLLWRRQIFWSLLVQLVVFYYEKIKCFHSKLPSLVAKLLVWWYDWYDLAFKRVGQNFKIVFNNQFSTALCLNVICVATLKSNSPLFWMYVHTCDTNMVDYRESMLFQLVSWFERSMQSYIILQHRFFIYWFKGRYVRGKYRDEECFEKCPVFHT